MDIYCAHRCVLPLAARLPLVRVSMLVYIVLYILYHV